jgi:hypothetical protein
MWEPRHLTTQWAFTVSYRDSFTFYLFFLPGYDSLYGDRPDVRPLSTQNSTVTEVNQIYEYIQVLTCIQTHDPSVPAPQSAFRILVTENRIVYEDYRIRVFFKIEIFILFNFYSFFIAALRIMRAKGRTSRALYCFYNRHPEPFTYLLTYLLTHSWS